jgi:ABC-type Fe3+-siderophore transport system permease subunit
MDEQIKELTNHVMNLRIELGKIDTKMDSIKDMQHKVEEHSGRLVAVEASAASAHHRLNGISRIVTSLVVGASLAVVGAVVTFVVKGGLAS